MSRMAASSSTMSTLGIGAGLWQLYPHAAPDARLRAHRNLPAHPLHEVLANRQAEAEAAGGALPRVVPLEEVGEVLLGDAPGPVFDGHRRTREAQPHRLAGTGMLDGVGHGDQERLLEQRRIGDDLRR